MRVSELREHAIKSRAYQIYIDTGREDDIANYYQAENELFPKNPRPVGEYEVVEDLDWSDDPGGPAERWAEWRVKNRSTGKTVLRGPDYSPTEVPIE